MTTDPTPARDSATAAVEAATKEVGKHVTQYDGKGGVAHEDHGGLWCGCGDWDSGPADGPRPWDAYWRHVAEAVLLAATSPTPDAQTGGGLSEAEKETLRLWLYEHNGSMGPQPVTEGAGGLPGLWSTVERILAARTAQSPTPDTGEARAADQFEVTQTVFASPELNEVGVYGNCIQAAVASLLGRPLDAVPHFGAFDDWEAALRLWARGEDLLVQRVDPDTVVGPDEERRLLFGTSPRGYGHVVVGSAEAGVLWDPHPSRDGLIEVTGVIRLIPLHTPATPDGGAE
jgi:hypothetical protein